MAGHWDAAYREKAIVDVGGGASVLGSRLLADGFSDVMVLDIAGAALAVERDERGFTGNTIAADVRE